MHSIIFYCLCLSLQISASAPKNRSSVSFVSQENIININSQEKKGSQFDVSNSLNLQYGFNYSLLSKTNKSIYSGDDMIKSSDNTNRNFSLMITFCAIALLIVLINLRVFRIVTTETQQRNRSTNFFVAHLSFLAIGFTCVVFIYVIEKSNVFSLTAPGLCETLSLLRNTILSLFPLNSAAITYVRTRCSTSSMSNTLLSFALFLIWTAATVRSLPSTFMVKYTQDSRTKLEKCKQKHFEVTEKIKEDFNIVFPILSPSILMLLCFLHNGPTIRFIADTTSWNLRSYFGVRVVSIFNLSLCGLLLHGKRFGPNSFTNTIFVHSEGKSQFNKTPIPNKMKRRIQRVRFVYLHSIIFILIWLPTGFARFLYKLRTRINWMADYIIVYITAIVVLSSSLFFEVHLFTSFYTKTRQQ